MDAFKTCEYTLARRQEAQCLSNFRRIKGDFAKLETLAPTKSLESKLLFKIESLDSQKFKDLLVSVVKLIEDVQLGDVSSSFGPATSSTSGGTNSSISKPLGTFKSPSAVYKTTGRLFNRLTSKKRVLVPKFHTSCFDPALQLGGGSVDEIVNSNGQDVISAYCTRVRGISKLSGGVAVLDSGSKSRKKGGTSTVSGSNADSATLPWPRNLSLAIVEDAPGISLPRHQRIVDLLDSPRENSTSVAVDNFSKKVAPPGMVQVSSSDYTGAMYPPLHSYNSGGSNANKIQPFEMPSPYMFNQRLKWRNDGNTGDSNHDEDVDYDLTNSADDLRSNYSKEMSSLYLHSEIFKGCMQSRLLYRLLSYKMANDKYSTFKQDSVAINKCIMQITWGGMWGHWHYFNNCLVPETTFQDFLESVAAGKLDGVNKDDNFNACIEFVESLRALPVGGDTTDELAMYRSVVSKYSDTLSRLHAWRAEIFAQMQTQMGASASLDSLYDVGAVAKAKELHAQQRLEHEQEEAKSAAEDLDRQRREALPMCNFNANDLADLCSIDKIFPIDPNIPCMHVATTATAKEFVNTAPSIFVAHLDAMISLLIARHRPAAGWNDVAKQLGKGFSRAPNQLFTWLFSTFYAGNNAGTYSLNSQGLVKLMCHVQFGCIYMSAHSSHVYNFGVLRRIDFKNRHELQLLFERCAKISSLVNAAGGAFSCTIKVPLVATQPIAPVASSSRISKRRRR